MLAVLSCENRSNTDHSRMVTIKELLSKSGYTENQYLGKSLMIRLGTSDEDKILYFNKIGDDDLTHMVPPNSEITISE